MIDPVAMTLQSPLPPASAMRVAILCAMMLVALLAAPSSVFAGRSASHFKPRLHKPSVADRALQVNTRPIIGIFSLANSDNANETGATMTDNSRP